jgi:beta-glucosidase
MNTSQTAAAPYLDPTRSIDERLADLLPRMTLEEKLGQMCQVTGQDKANVDRWLLESHVGSFLHVPLAEVIRLQRLAATTRLQIPIVFGEDAIHGHCFHPGATVFPTQLALSCAWSEELCEAMARVTAAEMTATGMNWTFSPVLCMPRDLRWGRVDETFGEDPLLIGRLASAMVRGYQGQSLGDRDSVLACAKHYAGYAMSDGGRDSYESRVSRRGLKAEFLPPFHAAADAGCATFMSGYQANDGVPCTIDRWLLRETLCEEWGLAGFVVTDWNNVGALVSSQRVCATLREATKLAIEAGNHMMMTTPDFMAEAASLVRDGELDETLIDDACRRILRMKFALGLFDHKRYPAEDRIATEIGCPAHTAVALDAARQSLVLLKNDGLLPLSAAVKNVAVIGPNADDVVGQLGDWSFGSQQAELATGDHPRANLITVRDGLQARSGLNVLYARGCGVLDPADQEIAAAVAVAQEAEVIIACVGDNLKNHGEGSDRAELNLSGAQQALLEALKATGKPLVVVLLNSKPLTIPWVAEHADAVVEAFNPGMYGGQAIAELLFGDFNPSGKLTISFPRHVGQLPVNYQQFPGWHTWGGSTGGYFDLPAGPLYPFGHGLSYTRFAYANLRLECSTLGVGEVLRAQVEVTNAGDRDGVEIVQLYVEDLVASVTVPKLQLKAFARVPLAVGETKTVTLDVPVSSLAIVRPDLQAVVEPGAFNVFVGPSSRVEELLKAELVVG